MNLKRERVWIKFKNEQGIDCGGPRKEFFEHLGREFTKNENPRYFTEREPHHFFPLHIEGIQHLKLLFNFGMLLGLSITMGECV